MADRTISQEDVERLMTDPSPEVRRETADKLTRGYATEKLTERERALIEEIFRLLLRDAEVRVRLALAEGLKENPDVPHDVAVALAKDVDEVAVPILARSMVFSDDDLIDIIRHARRDKQVAIAGREQISRHVSHALVRHAADEDVVTALLENPRAEIAERTFENILQRFSSSERVHDALIDRSILPLAISERLVSLVSDHLRARLVTRHELRPDLATELVRQARERATMSLLSPETDAMDVDQLVEQLWQHGRLTSTIVLRGLCMGDMNFFESALARLAGERASDVHGIVNDGNGASFETLYERAGLPPPSYRLARIAVDLHRELIEEGAPEDRNQFERMMLERLLTGFEDMSTGSEIVGSDNLDYFLNRLCSAA